MLLVLLFFNVWILKCFATEHVDHLSLEKKNSKKNLRIILFNPSILVTKNFHGFFLSKNDWIWSCFPTKPVYQFFVDQKISTSSNYPINLLNTNSLVTKNVSIFFFGIVWISKCFATEPVYYLSVEVQIFRKKKIRIFANKKCYSFFLIIFKTCVFRSTKKDFIHEKSKKSHYTYQLNYFLNKILFTPISKTKGVRLCITNTVLWQVLFYHLRLIFVLKSSKRIVILKVSWSRWPHD